MRRDEDNGPWLGGGAEAEDFGDAVLERVDDVLVARVAEERHRAWWVSEHKVSMVF